jgi:hypothetical protein
MHILSLVTATTSLLTRHATTGLMSTTAPVPEVSFVLQCGAVGTAIGSAIALGAKAPLR